MDRQLLLAKKETIYGTDAVAAAIDTILAEEVSFKLTGQRVAPDPAKPGVGPVASHVYGEHVEIGFKVPLAASGVVGVAPNWGKLLKACGWAETIVEDTSVTYALVPNPKGGDSMSLIWRDDRRLHKVLGWRGRVGLDLNAGARPMLIFNGRGLHQDVADGAALVQADATWTDWNDARPVAQGTTAFTFDGVTGLGIRQFNFDQSDNVRFIDVPEQENVDLVGKRAFTGRCRMTTPPASVLNLETAWKSGAKKVFAVTHESTPGKIATVNGRTQVVEPTYSRDNGDDVVEFGTELVPSAYDTDDDLSIVLT
ncbi:hypothetical protein [Phenylobacterium sp.]|uniref:hypothetical protein n=1 Tax=Phenylobacterium sp. TaxID=1871053 RepID=UPI0035B151AE